MIKIAHIINPVTVPDSSDLHIAQPITFESIRIAKEFSCSQVNIELFTAQYPEDRDLIPDFFSKTNNLNRSILDIGTFKKKRKLPLIRDIIDRLYNESDADYFVYTNVDISVVPFFYLSILSIIESGHDAFVINRRTISKKYSRPDQIYHMYSQIGMKHPGYDCFVFKREHYTNYHFGNACIGANWIGRVIITNLICNSNNFKVFENLHLTFHIGDDRSWKINDYLDYDSHNESELHTILKKNKELKTFNNNELVENFLTQIENKKSIRRKFERIWLLRSIISQVKIIHNLKKLLNLITKNGTRKNN